MKAAHESRFERGSSILVTPTTTRSRRGFTSRDAGLFVAGLPGGIDEVQDGVSLFQGILRYSRKVAVKLLL
jgi:hypothetical protein